MMGTARQRGMTLIELVVVVAIIAILSAIAYPNYVSYTSRAKRTDGKNALLDIATRQERYRFGNNSYANTLALLGITSSTTIEGHYTLTLPTATASAFTAQATPAATQATDKCQSLTLTNTGLKGTINSNSRTATECWQ